MELRPYQTNFVTAVESGWKEFRKQLGVAPTGSGKTIMFAHLANRLLESTGKKTLILAHREELIDQAIAKLYAATGIVAGKEKAEWTARRSDSVVVASVQTMIRRLDKWPADHFGQVVVDEAHRTLAESYLKVLNHFNGNANVLGVTATPDRGDKRSLGEFYENVPCEIGLIDLINDGYLCPISIKSIPLKIDLNQVSSIAGDFDSGELGHVLEPYLDQIAAAIKAETDNRKTLCFLPLIATSQKFVEACRSVGLSAEHIDGESEDRKERLQRFDRGDFQILSNAMLLSEGWDCPSVSCVVMLRPTRSRPLFAQCVGRGTRIFPGKKDLLLLDFLWLHQKHRIVHPASLIAKSEEEAEQITELAEAKAAGGEDEQLDLLELATTAQAAREEALRKKLAALADRQARFISAEEFAVRHHALAVAEWQPTMRWHEDPVTAPQAKYLEEAGINLASVKGKGHASQLLNVYFPLRGQQPASDKQKWVMRRAGFVSEDGKRNADSATKQDAIKFFASRK